MRINEGIDSDRTDPRAYDPDSTVLMNVDPSITSTGYSVFRGADLIASGCISTFADQPEPVRISIVLSELVTVIREHGVE